MVARLLIAAPASGHGKTTVATGLMAALARAGHVVSGHKVGPDYIDPGYHALATGRPGRNLDPYLVGEGRIAPLLRHGARGADIAVIEGVMGLYDGQIGGEGFASSAHVAALTRTPIVLVVDISHTSRSIGAIVHGLSTWDDSVEVVGVVLNKAGSPRHAAEAVAAVERSGLAVLGVLHRDDGISAPSRHLGLVPAPERPEAAASLDRLATQITRQLDLDAIVRLARSAPALDAEPWSPEAAIAPWLPEPLRQRPRIAIAGGRAFTFRYAETEELLRAAGCDVVVFDPTRDERLPEGTSGIYLGGGFPEMHAAELSGNVALRDRLRAAVQDGMPTVAECAGLLYLAGAVDGSPMAGVLDAEAAMAPRLTLAYREATATADNLLAHKGERVTGHEFHRTRMDRPFDEPAWEFASAPGTGDGVASRSLHAAYLHTHWAGHPQLAARFALACAERASAHDLRHHGDTEAGGGLLDFAVNVYEGAQPEWLRSALTASLAEVGRYPDAGEARRAVAGRHGRDQDEVLPTAGAAEAFGLVARLRPWRHPMVVHPQFTEPEVALANAGHHVDRHVLKAKDGFELDPAAVPDEADLVVLGNPTNPTGVRHRAADLLALLRPGRLVVVDEAFLDDGTGSLAGERREGLLVLRSLTKLWAVPGIRAGYAVGDATVIEGMARLQSPWSVSTPALAVLVACSSDDARAEADRRVRELTENRERLLEILDRLGVEYVRGDAPFVLARVGRGVHGELRERGIAARRCDTFPGLDGTWVRIACRGPGHLARLAAALTELVRTDAPATAGADTSGGSA